MYRIVQEVEFREVFTKALDEALRLRELNNLPDLKFVTGPGRSGAIAAVYASHHLGLPFVPFKARPEGRMLVVDTAVYTGKTLRKASKWYNDAPYVYAFNQERNPASRVKFWYEELSIVRGKGNEYVQTRRTLDTATP